jgi:hypothetical protein
MFKTLLAAALAAAALGGAPIPASAASYGVAVDVAPPSLRDENAPPPRHGRQWVPGYWNWNGHRHVWAPGVWVRERRGYVYAQPEWVERDGHWELRRGHWGRGDRDRDGIPDRFDRGRDGDGVPNYRDRHPDNPRRS